MPCFPPGPDATRTLRRVARVGTRSLRVRVWSTTSWRWNCSETPGASWPQCSLPARNIDLRGGSWRWKAWQAKSCTV